MKKNTLSFLFFAFSCMVMAQSQRIILAEEFTQASCPPCAVQNPVFNVLLGNNTTKVVAIKYQTSWPGVDPMNAQNPTDVAARVSYYNINGVPIAQMDGVEQSGSDYLGAPSNWTQAKIDTQSNVSSPFTINLNHTLSSDNDSIFITCMITASQAYTSNGILKAHIAMVEEEINFNSAPGTNGEKKFEHVMRKMYPSASGTTLPGTFTNGQSQTITISAPIPAYIYGKSKIGIVAFIQSNGDKAIQQTAYSIPKPLTSDIGSTSITGIAEIQCSSNFTPTITLKNFGTTTLTSCNINYKIDNASVSTQVWSGSLIAGATTSIILPTLNTTIGTHKFTTYTSAPNGAMDFDHSNDSTINSFITTSPTGISTPLIEGFNNNIFPPANWLITNPDNLGTWARYSGTGGFGLSNDCALMELWSAFSASEDELYAPNISFVGTSTASLTFNVAYAQYISENDKLEVKASSDCGLTWTTVYSKVGASLITAPPQMISFIPTATQWRAEAVNLNAFAGQTNVIVKFVVTSDYGNNLYIDDIIFSNSLVGMDEDKKNAINNIKLFPNPSKENIIIDYKGFENTNTNNIKIYDITGKEVSNYSIMNNNSTTSQLNISNFESGIYIITIQTQNKIIRKKFIKQ